ncbi:MAG: Gx transporter family protein [Magnetococcales bacterium]|nr:Gx transporter family protein [Magnetococcales bacterium]
MVPCLPVYRDLWVAYLAAAAIATHILEASLPGLGPWFKPGLANIFTLVAFFAFGWRAAVAVTMIRITAASMVLGTLFTPTIVLSLSGAAGALLALGMVRRLLPTAGPVGCSLLAALAHITAQLVAVIGLLTGLEGLEALMTILPWFLTASWLTGLFNGVVAQLILERMDGSVDPIRHPKP